MTKEKFVTIIKAACLIAFLIVAFGLAGRSDKQDAILVEMKNNGAYYQLSQSHPEASEEELINLYTEHTNK